MTAAPAVTLRGFGPADADWVFAAQARHYAEAEGFDARFEDDLRAALSGFLPPRDPGTDRGWIAVRDGRPRGCLFCAGERPDALRLRMFYLDGDLRGQGVGRRMLAAARDHAARCRLARLVVATHAEHRAAAALYARAGFRLCAIRPVQRYGRALTEQHWEFVLPAGQTLAIGNRGR